MIRRVRNNVWLPLRHRHVTDALACVVATAGVVALLSFGSSGAVDVIYHLLAGGAFVPARRAEGSFIGILAASLPTLVLCHLFGGFFSDGLAREAQYVFSRTGRRGKWGLVRGLQMVALVVGADILGSALATAAACLLDPGAPLADAYALCLWTAILRVPLDVVLVLAANLVALLLNPLLATVVIMGTHLATLIACTYVSKETARAIVPLLPSTQGVLAWHDCAALGEYIERVVAGFSVMGSVAYLICLAVVLGVALSALVRRADVLG